MRITNSHYNCFFTWQRRCFHLLISRHYAFSVTSSFYEVCSKLKNMKRKRSLLALLTSIIVYHGIAQIPPQTIKQKQLANPLKEISNIGQLCNELREAPYVYQGDKLKRDHLVSDYAFRKLIKKNFSNVILGNDNVSKIGRYATLDITDDNSFSFSPYTIESNPEKSYYQNIFSLNFSGKLNDKKIFKLSDYRDLSASISYAHILNWTNYTMTERPDAAFRKRFKDCILKAPLEELCEKYTNLENKIDACEPAAAREKKKKELRKSFMNDYTDLENELAEEFWRMKRFWWINIDVKFFGRDKFKYLTKSALNAKNYSPTETSIYTPGLTIGLNHFIKNNTNDNSFLFSIWGEVNKKHSLSEVFQPDDFQPFHSINDSLIQMKDVESVYITDFEEPSIKWTIDFGIRAVKMLDLSSVSRKRQIGFSLLFSRDGLVSDGSFPSLFRTEAGIVIPFLKSDGESSFNLEIFRRWDNFSNFPSDNDHFWGLRFNIPISSK